MQERRWGTAVLAGNWCSSCGGPAVVAGDAAAAWPGTAAVGPQTGQLRGGSPDGGARLGLSFALHLPQRPLPPSRGFYSHSLPASTQSPLPVAETGECRGVSCSLISSHEKKYRLSLGRNPRPCLPAETQILYSTKPNLHLISSFDIQLLESKTRKAIRDPMSKKFNDISN